VELEATGSASGRLICSRYAAVLGVGLRLAEFERSLILARTSEGRDALGAFLDQPADKLSRHGSGLC
jgi:hypothetical protein